MTVTTAPSYQDYVGNGSDTDFAIPFNFQSQASWIHVYDISTSQIQKTEFVQGVDYNVITGSDQRVVFTTAPGDLMTIQVRRVTPRTQTISYPTTGGFPNASHERAVDKLVMIIQDLYDSVALGDFNPASVLSLGADGQYDALGHQIKHLAAGTDGDDAVTVAQATAIATGGVVTNFGGFGVDTFAADGGTDFELTVAGVDAADLIVTINGQTQIADPVLGSYTVDNSGNPLSGSILKFGTAPDVNDVIEVRWPKGTVVSDIGDIVITTGNYGDGSITPAKLATSPAYQNYVLKTIVNNLGIASVAWLPLIATDIGNIYPFLASIPLNFFIPTPLNLNLNKISNLGDGTAGKDAVNLDQLSLRRRTKSGTAALLAGSVTLTFPWNVASVTFFSDGPGSEDHTGCMTFGFSGTQTSSTNTQIGGTSRAWTATRSTSGSNKLVAFTMTGGGTATLHYCGVEGDA